MTCLRLLSTSRIWFLGFDSKLQAFSYKENCFIYQHFQYEKVWFKAACKLLLLPKHMEVKMTESMTQMKKGGGKLHFFPALSGI